MTNQLISNDITLKIDGKPCRFAGNEGILLRTLLAHQQQAMLENRLEVVTKEELQMAIWGVTLEAGQSGLWVLVYKINSRRRGLVVKSTFEPGYYLTRQMVVELSKRRLAKPKPGRPAGNTKPTLIVSVAGHGHQKYHGREAALMRFMFRDRMAYKNAQQVATGMGLTAEGPKVAYKYTGDIRGKAADIFETGGWGRGWRLNPRVRMYVVYDEEEENRRREGEVRRRVVGVLTPNP